MLEKEVRHFLAPMKGFMHFVHGHSSKRNSQIKMVEVSLKMRLEYIVSPHNSKNYNISWSTKSLSWVELATKR